MSLSIKIFGVEFKLAWWVTVVALGVVELTPFHSEGMPPKLFYTWKLFKCLLFFALGLETPLTFWRSNILSGGLLFACLSASVVEGVQGLAFGHSFSMFELAAKVAIIFAGFVVGLIARHDESFGIRRFQVHLVPKHKA